MKLNFPNEVFGELIAEARAKGMSAPALIVEIVKQHQQNSPLKDEKLNDSKRDKGMCR